MARPPVHRSSGRRKSAPKGRFAGLKSLFRLPSFKAKTRERAPQRRTVQRRAAPRGKKRSFLGFLWRFSLTGALVGVIGIACVVGYYASFLPPIDQIAIPKRPPNISILASDGTL
ncbi:MAG: hypothetical protein LBR29_03020, partial [Methylobacteriaceae bacterium]|nr:hypothetical protein [Methylobacteriaceae bacterium]